MGCHVGPRGPLEVEVATEEEEDGLQIIVACCTLRVPRSGLQWMQVCKREERNHDAGSELPILGEDEHDKLTQ